MIIVQRLIAAGAVVFVLSGCATITRGTKEMLIVESNPSGANVTLSNGMKGETPTSFKISRKGNVTVTIEKEGYKPVVVNIKSKVAKSGAAGMAGNVLLGGIIGLGIDTASGASLKLNPNPVKVDLVPLTDSGETKPVSFNIQIRKIGEDNLLVTVMPENISGA